MNNILKKLTSTLLLGTMLVYTTSPVFAFTKDETVYSKLDVNGKNYNTIVNNHIVNSEQVEFINDLSDLLNIINTNGDETFTQNGNNLIWSANGNDIYYQGETQKELPVECKIKYELDGKEISANEIVGKAGTVKIILEYVNKDAHTVIINGKSETLYTPFVVLCGTIINNENNKNITISSGKLIDDGTKTIALGIATPGLQESLNLAKSTIDIPSSIEITMDAKDFELGTMITYITPKIINDEDLNIFDKVDYIFTQVDTLQSSSHQLVEGANTLKEGTQTYSEKFSEFNGAVKQISDGIIYANSNYSKIDDGIATLNQKAPTLVYSVQNLSDGIGKVSGALNTINSSLSAVPDTQVVDSINQIVDGINPIISGLNSVSSTDNSSKIATLEGLIQLNTNEIKKLTTLNTSLETQKNLLTSSATIDQTEIASVITTLDSQIAENTVLIGKLTANNQAHQTTITTLQATDGTQMTALVNGLNTIQSGLSKLLPGIKGIYSLKPAINQLADSSTLLADGANKLTEGTEQLTDGINSLADGSAQMKSGLTTLSSGAKQLSNASNQLTDGANTISTGATTLSEGMTKFNDEGINKICNYINGNLRDIKVRVEKLQDLSNEYNTFSMLNENDKGIVKFILITDSLSKNSITKENDDKKDDE